MELEMEDLREGGFISRETAGVPGCDADGVRGPGGTLEEAVATDSSMPWSDAAEVKTDSVSDIAVLSRRFKMGRDPEADPKEGCRELLMLSLSFWLWDRNSILPFDWWIR